MVKARLKQWLRSSFSVKDRYEQNALLHQLLNSEKWIVYIILTFVLVIAICNIIGSLTMLVIDKKKDIAILFSMGAGLRQVRKIFMAEGMLIAGGGCLRSEEHTSELQSLMRTSYAVFCLKIKTHQRLSEYCRHHLTA